MFCPNCGASAPDSARFCPSCGFDLEEARSLAKPAPEPEAPAPEPETSAAVPPAPEPASTAPEPGSTAPAPAPAAPVPEAVPAAPPAPPADGSVPPAPAPAPAAPEPRKSNSGIVIAIVIVVALAVILALLFFVFRPMVFGGGDAGDQPQGQVEEEAEDWQDPACTDAHGNPTGYACLNLDGDELTELLLDNDYYWSNYDECYLRDSDRAALGVMDSSGALMGRNDIRDLDTGGEGEPILIINSLGGYDTIQECFDEGLGVELADPDYYSDPDLIAAMVTNEDGEDYLVLCYAHIDGSGSPDGTMDLVFVNDDGVAYGLFEQMTGVSGFSSVSEAWDAISSGAAASEAEAGLSA